MAINKKLAIVTGAASGIGAAYSTRLVARGYRVVLADINVPLGTKLQSTLGPSTTFIPCDVSSWESNASMFKAAYEWGGRINLFIANAGIEESENFYDFPGEGEEPIKPSTKVIDVNLFSVLYGLRLFRHYNRLSKREGECARMFVTTSMAGFYEFPAAPIYSAAKHALVGLVRASSIKLRRDESILINAVGPGPVDTPIAAMLKNFVPAEQFTPMELMVKALDKVIDEDVTGQVIECTNKDLNLVKFAEFSCENSRELIEAMTRH